MISKELVIDYCPITAHPKWLIPGLSHYLHMSRWLKYSTVSLSVSLRQCKSAIQCKSFSRLLFPTHSLGEHWHSSGSSRQPQRSDYSVGRHQRWWYCSGSRPGSWTQLPECAIRSQAIRVWKEHPGETRKGTADSSLSADTQGKNTRVRDCFCLV